MPVKTINIRKVDLLLKYILAVAGQEDPGNREVGPIHLIKYIYLADMLYAEKHGGETYSGAPWRFHHFGPWSPEVFNRIEPVIAEVGAKVKQIPSSKEEGDLIRYSLDDDNLYNQLEAELPLILAVGLKGLIHKFGDDTTSLLHYVYRTPPMLRAAPGEPLSFKGEPFDEEDRTKVAGHVSDIVDLYQAASPKKLGGPTNCSKFVYMLPHFLLNGAAQIDENYLDAFPAGKFHCWDKISISGYQDNTVHDIFTREPGNIQPDLDVYSFLFKVRGQVSVFDGSFVSHDF